MVAKPKILIVAKGFSPDPGGIETYGADLANAFRDMGFRVRVVTQRQGAAGLSRSESGVVINVGSGVQWKVFLKMLVVLWRLRRKNQIYELTYATTWRVAVPLILCRFPVFKGVTIHGREVLVPTGILKRIMRWTFQHVDGIFAVSQFTLDAARNKGALESDEGVRNWNGYRLPSELAERPLGASCPDEKQKSVRVFTICRLVPRKNLVKAVLAIGKLAIQYPELQICYDIAGDGESRKEIEDTIAEHSLQDIVVVHGRVTDEQKASLYQSADIFLHPQIALADGADVEGFGLVIAEAMAHRLAVVVGSEGGTADFVKDGESGKIVDGNAIQDIVDGLRPLMLDLALRHSISADGHQWVTENLSWQKHAETILERLHAFRFASTKRRGEVE